MRPPAAAAYMAKARRALKAARLLNGEDESEGTCNRAYYAMFYAAHAALLTADAGVPEYKTHRGLVAAFGKRIVVAGLMDADFGRSLNEVQKIRELADYLGDPPPYEAASQALRLAEDFVVVVEGLLRDGASSPTS